MLARDSGDAGTPGRGGRGRRGSPMELWRGVYRALGVVPTSDPSLPAQERRWEHLESLADALPAQAPLVVILEDLHWADAFAVWVLEHLPRALGDAPVRGRRDQPGQRARHARAGRSAAGVAVVPLGGLDVDAVPAGSRTRGRRQRTASVRRGRSLHARTGGQSAVRPGADPVTGRQRRHRRSSPAIPRPVRRRHRAGLGDGRDCRVPAPPLSLLAMRVLVPDGRAGRSASTPARREGVLDEVSRGRRALPTTRCWPRRRRRLADPRERARPAGGGMARGRRRRRAGRGGGASAAGPPAGATAVADAVDGPARSPPSWSPPASRRAPPVCCGTAREVAADGVERRELRANVTLDLAEVLSWLGDLDPALVAVPGGRRAGPRVPRIPSPGPGPKSAPICGRPRSCPTCRGCAGWRTRWTALPPEELRLRARLLGRLTIVGGADVDATERVRAWADEAVAVSPIHRRPHPDRAVAARPDQFRPPGGVRRPTSSRRTRSIRLAERAGRSDLAVYGHQRRAGHHLNHADLGAASQSPWASAEVLAALLPSPWWRQSTLVQRTTLLALSGSRPAAAASMYEAVQSRNRAHRTGRRARLRGDAPVDAVRPLRPPRPAGRGDPPDHHADAERSAVTGVPGAEGIRRATVR